MLNLLYHFTLFLMLLSMLAFTIGTVLVVVALLWSFLKSYLDWICGRSRLRHCRLTFGNIPVATTKQVARAKSQLASSCEVHRKCIPRAGWYGLISHPLSIDE